MALERPVLFVLFGLPVTTTVATTAGMAAFLALLAIVAGAQVRPRASRWQAMLEWGVGAVEGMLAETTGATGARYVPLVATIGVFILVANTMSVLPFVEAPTADVNTPIALALIVLGAVQYYGVRELGPWAYVKKFARPSPLLLPITLLSQLTRTLSLAIRLFGNMISHQIIVAILLLILPLLVPALLQVFGLFVGVIQAYLFTVLTAVYIGGAVQAEGE